MTLEELGREYLAQAEVLRERLRELRQQAKTQDDPLLQRRIYYLFTSAKECRTTGEYLLGYHRKEKQDEANAIE